MKRTGIWAVLFGILLFCSGPTYAWLRSGYEDATVVDRCELIVVAHLKEGTIEYVPHKKPPGHGASWEHHAVLAITQVLKGTCKEKEIPVIVHYGLTPVVGGHVKRDNFEVNLRGGRKDYPDGVIEILDTGNSGLSFSPLVKDARKDNLWFLRKRSGTYGRKPGSGRYGIVDPEDLRPLAWKEYFLAYMAADPGAAVRKWANAHPDAADRAERYLVHLEVQRILKVKDAEARGDMLILFYLAQATWNGRSEARDGLVACGETAGKGLRLVFENPEYAAFRSDIIGIWREIGYRPAVPILIQLLKKHDGFWAQQNLEEGWWNRDVGSELTRRRRVIYSQVYSGVCALRRFRDPRAKEVLVMTRDRWRKIGFSNPQILEECEAALRELSAAEQGSQEHGAPAGMR